MSLHSVARHSGVIDRYGPPQLFFFLQINKSPVKRSLFSLSLSLNRWSLSGSKHCFVSQLYIGKKELVGATLTCFSYFCKHNNPEQIGNPKVYIWKMGSVFQVLWTLTVLLEIILNRGKSIMYIATESIPQLCYC